MNIVFATGGFDPIHSGHIGYLSAASKLGDYLIVGLNSDAWLTRKKGRPFMSWEERATVLNALNVVDEVIAFDDSDGTANLGIYKLLQRFPNNRLIFANGGDRIVGNIPEWDTYGKTPWVQFEFGVGGEDKKNSSSWILEDWKSPKTIRPWGWYRVLDEKPGYKVKELVITPGASLSNQRHAFRSENWYVLTGQCSLLTEFNSVPQTVTLGAHSGNYVINPGVWHQASNPGTEPCHILEVQYGSKCEESDIERKE